MVDISRILCPVDFSDYSRHALDHARALAGWYGARVTVLHVYGPQEMPLVGTDVPATVTLPPPIDPAHVRERVVRFYALEGGGAGAGVDILVEEGMAARTIVSRAEQMDASLLVMATHGRSGFDRLFLGSVAEKVLRTTQVPVLTVPPPVDQPGSALYRRILCPIDFSDASTRALEYALSLAKEADARLVLLHVVEGTLDTIPPDAVLVTVPEYQRRVHDEAAARLNAALPAEARVWCSPDVQIATGKPYREILRVAEATSAELIVMGVHGRGALNRWLFGSSTHHVIRHVTCPVLTLRG